MSTLPAAPWLAKVAEWLWHGWFLPAGCQLRPRHRYRWLLAAYVPFAQSIGVPTSEPGRTCCLGIFWKLWRPGKQHKWFSLGGFINAINGNWGSYPLQASWTWHMILYVAPSVFLGMVIILGVVPTEKSEKHSDRFHDLSNIKQQLPV